MDISKWETFVTVSRMLNITLAAEHLNMSQSGVSYVLKCLEQETGFPLFIRHKQGVALTSAAKELLPLINDFLNEKGRIEQVISQISGLTRGNLQIGSYQSTAITWIPEVLRQFKNDFPQIQIEIWDGASEAIETALVNREIDFAFTSWRKRPDCEWIDLAEDHLLAILPDGHSLASAQCVPLEMFSNEPFIASTKHYEHDMNYFLKIHGIKPCNIVCNSSDDFSTMSLVRKGLGATLLFNRTVKAGGITGLIAKKTEPSISRKLGIAIVSLERASPAAKIFIEYACDILSGGDDL